MFGFLRRHRIELHVPLLDAAWDGGELRLACVPASLDRIALELDGSHFADIEVDARGHARCAFPFAPSGTASAMLLPRRTRDGAALAATPLRIVFGKAGFESAPPGAGDALLEPLASSCLLPFGTDIGAREAVVVVPVYNAAPLVERCLDALLAHTRGNARIVVIDDASSDPAIAPLLARFGAQATIEVLRNESNRAYTATANRGFAAAGGADVVLLNADAEVGPNWLAGLRRAAYAADDIATATAVSDNAGAFSVPELERENPLPACWTPHQAMRALWQDGGLACPELPTGNGFCLYIRRSVIDAIGALDEDAFPQGYGEENDFCQRAAQRGLRHVIAGNVLVRHARSASFGDERRAALGRSGMVVLRERWPDYEAEVARNLHSYARCVLDWRVRRIWARARADNAPKARVLWVGSDPPGWNDVEVWWLRANGKRNELVFDGRVVAANDWNARDPETSYRASWDWLQLHAIERLVVAERTDSAVAILCGLLDIPVTLVARPFAPSAALALALAGDILPARAPIEGGQQ
jgi:GT2 family glycosyltransferase